MISIINVCLMLTELSFERRCHQGVRQSEGSCVLILASFWLDLAHIEDAEGLFLV